MSALANNYNRRKIAFKKGKGSFTRKKKQKIDSAILYLYPPHTHKKKDSIPMIFIDECHNNLLHKNILIPDSINSPNKEEIYILEQLRMMKIENDPILIILPKDQDGVIDTQKVYYNGSQSLHTVYLSRVGHWNHAR